MEENKIASASNQHTYEDRVCTMCGWKLDEFDLAQNFTIDHYISYGSKHDLEHLHVDLCNDCLDRLIDWLTGTCIHNPIDGEYDVITGPMQCEAT